MADKTLKTGPVKNVPCPHCGRGNDLSEIQKMGALQPKERYDCDHCSKTVEIVNSMFIVQVRAFMKPQIAVASRGDRIGIEVNGKRLPPYMAATLDRAAVTIIAQQTDVDYSDLRAAILSTNNQFLSPDLKVEETGNPFAAPSETKA